MNEPIADNPAGKPWTKRPRWKLRAVCFALVVFAILSVYLWISLPTAIVISRETTWLTEPLTADGQYVDFPRALHEKFPAMRGKWEDSPWYLLTYNVPSRPLTVPYEDPEQTIEMESTTALQDYLNQRSAYPFSEDDDPVLAGIISENEPWYAAALAMKPGPSLMPSNDGSFYSLRVGGGPNDKLIRRFALRTMLAFGTGDMDKGFEGLKFQMEVHRHTRQLPGVLGAYLALEQEAEMSRQIWSVALLCPDLGIRLLEIIAQLPTPEALTIEMVERFDFFERLIDLHELQEFHRGRPTMLMYRFFPRDQENRMQEWARVKMLWKRIDFNELMRRQNESIEEMKRILRIEDVSARSRELNDLFHTIDDIETAEDAASLGFAVIGDPTDTISKGMRYHIVGSCSSVSNKILHATNRFRLCHLAVRLAAFKDKYKRYPDSLLEVAEMDGVQSAPSNMTLDVFTGEEFRYASDGETLRIQSWGPNGVDDTNTMEQPDWYRVNDDLIWSSTPGQLLER
ncbi:MAG: hypothetical protein WKF77_04260 [Planctomycetaceae bacterium]